MSQSIELTSRRYRAKLAPPGKTHLLRGVAPACRCVISRHSQLTRKPDEVTCVRCLRLIEHAREPHGVCF